MRCGCMFCWWNMFVVTWFEGDVSPAEDVTRGDGEQSEVLTVLDLTLAERQGHCIQLVPYAVAWGSPRTPSNKYPEIILQFYHQPYFWSATFFLKISNQTQLGELAWMKKKLSFTVKATYNHCGFPSSRSSTRLFFSLVAAAALSDLKKAIAQCICQQKALGAFWSSFMPDLDEGSAFETRSSFYQYNCFLGWIPFKTSKTKWHNLKKKPSICLSFFRESIIFFSL